MSGPESNESDKPRLVMPVPEGFSYVIGNITNEADVEVTYLSVKCPDERVSLEYEESLVTETNTEVTRSIYLRWPTNVYGQSALAVIGELGASQTEPVRYKGSGNQGEKQGTDIRDIQTDDIQLLSVELPEVTLTFETGVMLQLEPAFSIAAPVEYKIGGTLLEAILRATVLPDEADHASLLGRWMDEYTARLQED